MADAMSEKKAVSKTRKVKLKSSDDEVFEVDWEVASQIQMVKDIVELCNPTKCEDEDEDEGSNPGSDQVIPLLNVNAKILAKVIEYCTYHAMAAAAPDAGDGGMSVREISEAEVRAWDAEFVKVEQSTIFDLILAANYLNCKDLLDLTCLTVADMIKGKTPEEIRIMFNIQDDFTPEEEEEVRRENAWAFE